ncbi:MAG: hypothetical protein CMF39_03000 [Legionellaceae bacterium]|nr:hypothetical protein [Legionellaceae bacterium]|tara:strand:- start:771 stop:1442 length:672 start_codon:yes stop_codon:yes gene_type:complete
MAALSHSPVWFEQHCETLKQDLDLVNVLYGHMVSVDQGFLLGSNCRQPYENQLVLQRKLQVGDEFFGFVRSVEKPSIREEYVFRPAAFDQGVFYLREKIAAAIKQSLIEYRRLSVAEVCCFERWKSHSSENDKPSDCLSVTPNAPRRRYYLYADNPKAYVTARELEYLRLLVKGYKSASIAETLSVSSHTVDAQLRNIRKRLGCRNIIEVVNILYQNRLLVVK